MTHINWNQVRKVAETIASLPDDFKPLNFYSFSTPDGEVVAKELYPTLNHPAAIDFFFFTSLHNYGFWHGDGSGYTEPLFGKLGGKERKGSDMLWRISMRQLDRDPGWFHPSNLAQISENEMLHSFFVDDSGTIPFADLKERAAVTREYGQWFVERSMTPSGLVDLANEHDTTLASFLVRIGEVRGFDADPLEKRQMLLAMELHNRPEVFLRVTDPENWRPIVDYHVMRVCLRSGMVELDKQEAEVNRGRTWIDAETEDRIRKFCYDVMQSVEDRSSRSHAVIDYAFWSARRFCPEMTDPKCDKCTFSIFCAKRTELFQPILRTTAY